MDDSREKFEEFVRRAFSTTDYTMARDHDGLYYNRVWRDEKGLSGVADVSALWMAWSAGRASAAAERDALLLDCRSFLLEEQKLKAERDALKQDAERYRCLRDPDCDQWSLPIMFSGDELDREIDRAMPLAGKE